MSEDGLLTDEQAWCDKVDEYIKSQESWKAREEAKARGEILPKGERVGFNKSAPILLLRQTPPVFGLLGANTSLPVTINPRHFDKMMGERGKHHLPPELIKQVPRSLTEPVMIYSDTQDAGKRMQDPDTTFIVMLELQHEGKSLVVPFTLNKEQRRRRYNILDSVYDRDGRDIGESGKIHEDWFLAKEQIEKLLYADYEKVRRWAVQSDKYNKSHPEAQSASLARAKSLLAIWEALLQDGTLPKSIKTREELVNVLPS